MNDSKITRRGFLSKAAAVAALPFVASALSSCGEELNSPSAPNKSASNKLDAVLNAEETVSVKNLKKSNLEGSLVKVSNSLFLEPNLIPGKGVVLCKVSFEGKTRLQLVQVKVVETSASFKVVQGLPSEAELFVNPNKAVSDMIAADKKELKKRFMRAQLWQGEKI